MRTSDTLVACSAILTFMSPTSNQFAGTNVAGMFRTCVDVFHVKNRGGIREEDELLERTKKRGGEWWRVQGTKFIKGVKKKKKEE